MSMRQVRPPAIDTPHCIICDEPVVDGEDRCYLCITRCVMCRKVTPPEQGSACNECIAQARAEDGDDAPEDPADALLRITDAQVARAFADEGSEFYRTESEGADDADADLDADAEAFEDLGRGMAHDADPDPDAGWMARNRALAGWYR